MPDPERAPFVRELFERYAGGQESDRSLAAWLNKKGVRSAKGRPFSKDTVREILLNSAYCGYVGGLRSKDRSVRGLHEPIVSEELFDRVQEARTWRARVVKPGPPSEDYLLRKLLHCERCGARMHGTRGSRPPVRRYLCSTRRHGDGCDQPITRAEPLEEQLVDWISDFRPDEDLRAGYRPAEPVWYVCGAHRVSLDNGREVSGDGEGLGRHAWPFGMVERVCRSRRIRKSIVMSVVG